MAGKNRHLYGDIKPILVQIPGAVACSAGDLMFLNTAVSNQAYPFDALIGGVSTGTWHENILHVNFLGVSMEDSKSGVTENITIATDGVFRFPVYGGPSAVTIGSKVSAVSSSLYASGADHVSNEESYSVSGSTAILGICVKTQSGASYVDFRIIPAKSTGVTLV